MQGHPDMNKVPGVDMTTGSLGQGLSAANGMAIAGKLDNKDYRVYCIMGDGEIEEGQIWEAAMTANKYKLDNFIVFVDENNLQLDGTCDQVMPNGDLAAKFEAFGWETFTYDGNDMDQTVEVLDKCYASQNGKPKALIGKTVKGKGVSFMENKAKWHHGDLNDLRYNKALKELEGI